jgi:hypothetical protein
MKKHRSIILAIAILSLVLVALLAASPVVRAAVERWAWTGGR